jgi:hypothetical protein
MIRQIPWTDAIEQHLQHPAGAACIDYLRAEVHAGVSKLWHCKSATHEAYMVTRLDRNPDELVVCYFQGTGLQHFAPTVIEGAHLHGIPVRAHTSQQLVARLLRRVGLREAETVMRSVPAARAA